MTNLPCECQELKPKGETNSSFLVLHPLSGVHTVKTVGSHLKQIKETLTDGQSNLLLSNQARALNGAIDGVIFP